MALDILALRDLNETKAAVTTIFTALREGDLGDGQRITVDEAAALHGISRREAIEALRGLAEVGAGEFKVGRKGHPSRLEWSVEPDELIAILDGEVPMAAARVAPLELRAPSSQGSLLLRDDDDDDDDPGPEPDEESDEEPEPEPVEAAPDPTPTPVEAPRVRGSRRRVAAAANDAGGTSGHLRLLEHVHRLRPNLEIRVTLPEDLSPREAAILGDWIRNLSFDR